MAVIVIVLGLKLGLDDLDKDCFVTETSEIDLILYEPFAFAILLLAVALIILHIYAHAAGPQSYPHARGLTIAVTTFMFAVAALVRVGGSPYFYYAVNYVFMLLMTFSWIFADLDVRDAFCCGKSGDDEEEEPILQKS